MRNLEDLALITDTSKLEGTTYIELLPGPYKNKCWNKESVYIDTEHPHYRSLENLFEKHFKDFDLYSFEEYSKYEWLKFSDLLKNSNTENIPSSFIDDLDYWLKRVLEEHDEVTFMGL